MIWGIVVAAGTGSRYGAPKQFEQFKGERLVDRAVRQTAKHCDAVVVVLPTGVAWDGPNVDAAIPGGETRSASVRAGLEAIPESAEIIVLHDAARPLASERLFKSVIHAIEQGADAAIPGIPVVDTVKRVSDDVVLETVSRDELVLVQTPQAFRASVLRAAHALGKDATDDAGLVEDIGGKVIVVSGENQNRKITTDADLRLAEVLEDFS